MIISFAIENWKSFKNPAKITMVARDIREHDARVQSLDQLGIKMLPIAAIYGGNASGKTNLIDALKFARTLVVDGIENKGIIPVIPFMLEEVDDNYPTRFKFELVIDEIIYKYQFTVTKTEVLEEILEKAHSDKSEVLLFQRNKQNFNFGLGIDNATAVIVAKSTSRDELVLHNSHNLNFKQFLPVYEWFQNSLCIISPDTKFLGLNEIVEENGSLLERLNEALYYFDTGMSGIEVVKFDTDVSEDLLPEGIIPIGLNDEQLSRNLSLRDSSFTIVMNNGKPELRSLVSNHHVTAEKKVKFGLHLESEGSRRLLDLLPSFLNLTTENKMRVLVVDEIDRSMHPDLTSVLLKKYLDTSSELTRNQLVFTTHDICLLGQGLFRRDEIWVTERKSEDISQLYSFGDFKDIKKNESILELYKSGVLGGKPHILFKHSTTNPFLEQNDED